MGGSPLPCILLLEGTLNEQLPSNGISLGCLLSSPVFCLNPYPMKYDKENKLGTRESLNATNHHDQNPLRSLTCPSKHSQVLPFQFGDLSVTLITIGSKVNFLLPQYHHLETGLSWTYFHWSMSTFFSHT